ncbi:sulfurtransferase complex subunit TusD [Amphritea balenae]|uniref:Sulfurtransferase complex subunit TusD n=1 Tax=Amphritea balenae TaxID=452629 RepID=A0A3P1SP14_9GAMM|nr:sulfurtransferase complex subunit TusD [Amphritea balenae]RRC97962.1 sulfurtransferase complex subunit TusD [Amphritea balenae]GGK82121.1 sulfurtransferase TusD [Amphritea balenae]
MIFSIVITGAPYSSQASDSALRYCQSLLNLGHSIHRVFFYADGVHSGSSLAAPPQDESNIPAQWAELAKNHELDLVVCIAAAVRRGIIDADEARRYEKSADNLAQPFALSGLGQLVEAGIVSDRIVTFGA